MLKRILTAGATTTAYFGLKKFKKEEDFCDFSSPEEAPTTRNAICILYPNRGSRVMGLISFQQENISTDTKIVASIKNLNPNSVHGLLIHSQGDLTEGVTTLGQPYNPFDLRGKNNEDFYRFTGDMGNLKTNEKGEGYLAYTHPYIKLFGEGSVYGRSCVVYSDANNSQTGLNDSDKLAAGVIGVCEEFKNFVPSA